MARRYSNTIEYEEELELELNNSAHTIDTCVHSSNDNSVHNRHYAPVDPQVMRQIIDIHVPVQTNASTDHHIIAIDDHHPIEVMEIDAEMKNNTTISSYYSIISQYTIKFHGIHGKEKPPRLSLYEIAYNYILSFTGILIITVADYYYLKRTFDTGAGDTSVLMLIGSFGATAVLVFDLYNSPPAQPRNCILGHSISAFIGVSVRLAFEGNPHYASNYWVQAPIAVATSIAAMDLFQCIHPPGATALIAVIGGPPVYNLGYAYMLTCMGGALICVCVACFGNNLIPSRQYPLYWW